jgi:hypothetical protein
LTHLFVAIVLHAVLGIVLAGAVWALGLAALLLAQRRLGIDPGSGAFAYPIGLLVLTAAAALALVQAWLGLVGLALLAGGLAVVARREHAALRRALRPVVWAVLPIGAFAAALGWILHGPSSRHGSSAFGDMVFYDARLVSFATSGFPSRDLLAAGRELSLIESSPTLVGAALADLPGFDPFLFHASALPAFMLASVAIGLGLVTSRDAADRAGARVPLTLVAIASIAYPTWLVESPPVAMAVPLAFAFFELLRRSLSANALAVLCGLLAADLFLTKILGVVPLGAVVAANVHRNRAQLDLRRSALAVAAVALATAAVLGYLTKAAAWSTDIVAFKFLPAGALRGLGDQLTRRDTQAAAPAVLVLGQALLAIALVRARGYAVFAALASAVAGGWLVAGHSFDIAVGLAVLLAALWLWTDPARVASQSGLVLAAGVALAVSAWFRDISAIRAGFVLVLLLGASLLAMLFALSGAGAREYAEAACAIAAAAILAVAGHPFVGFAVLALLGALTAAPVRARLPLQLPRTAALGAALLLSIGAAGTAARSDDLRLRTQRETLTPDHHDVWQAVHRVVPPDGIVFTSLTGRSIDSDHGWNYYPGVAGRQIYIAGWYDSPLRVLEDELERRLAANTRVLSGEVEPEDVPWTSGHETFFAVQRRREPVPSWFRLLYRNDRFALYRIDSRGT